MPHQSSAPVGATIAGVDHHYPMVNGQRVHYVSAGDDGAPIVLIHGFPESWWTFHHLIPLLAATTVSSRSTFPASATPTSSVRTSTATPPPRCSTR